MKTLSYIHVDHELYSTPFSISKRLNSLADKPIMSFDVETQSIYSLEERAEAKELLKSPESLSQSDLILCKLVANSSGLSHPSIVKVTHFIFGLSESHSVIFIAYDYKTELLIWNWLAQYKGTLLIHNAQFDLKLMHHRINQFPHHYEDTQLAVKSLINHVEVWKANTGLKELVGSYYDPKWTMIETYDVINYKDPDFIRYCAIDGAGTFLLWNQIQEQIKELTNET